MGSYPTGPRFGGGFSAAKRSATSWTEARFPCRGEGVSYRFLRLPDCLAAMACCFCRNKVSALVCFCAACFCTDFGDRSPMVVPFSHYGDPACGKRGVSEGGASESGLPAAVDGHPVGNGEIDRCFGRIRVQGRGMLPCPRRRLA